MAAGQSTIIYTPSDEAPLLATCSFLPVVRAFTAPAGIVIEKPIFPFPRVSLPNFRSI